MIENRLSTMGARRLVAIVLAEGVAATSPTAAAAAPAKPPKPAAASREPGEESLSERRAVRGVPVDDAATPETPELRELRRFEEQAFPRTGAALPSGGVGCLFALL